MQPIECVPAGAQPFGLGLIDANSSRCEALTPPPALGRCGPRAPGFAVGVSVSAGAALTRARLAASQGTLLLHAGHSRLRHHGAAQDDRHPHGRL
eukprot:3608115-Prymnesium_polylepis.1